MEYPITDEPTEQLDFMVEDERYVLRRHWDNFDWGIGGVKDTVTIVLNEQEKIRLHNAIHESDATRSKTLSGYK